MAGIRSVSNLVYQIQYLTILLILDLQENIYTLVPKTHYPSAGEAGRGIVGVLDLFIDIFLELQNKHVVKYCI